MQEGHVSAPGIVSNFSVSLSGHGGVFWGRTDLGSLLSMGGDSLRLGENGARCSGGVCTECISGRAGPDKRLRFTSISNDWSASVLCVDDGDLVCLDAS